MHGHCLRRSIEMISGRTTGGEERTNLVQRCFDIENVEVTFHGFSIGSSGYRTSLCGCLPDFFRSVKIRVSPRMTLQRRRCVRWIPRCGRRIAIRWLVGRFVVERSCGRARSRDMILIRDGRCGLMILKDTGSRPGGTRYRPVAELALRDVQRP